MRIELYQDSKLMEIKEVLDISGKIKFRRYDGNLILLEERDATPEEQQQYQQDEADKVTLAELTTIKTLAEKSTDLTTTEIKQGLKLLLKHWIKEKMGGALGG